LTTSTVYVDLTTVGPSTTLVVPPSGRVLLSVATGEVANAGSTSCLMSYEATGANTLVASDANAVILGGVTRQRASALSVLSGLTPGSTTFTAQCKAQGSGSVSCSFSDGAILAVPLPWRACAPALVEVEPVALERRPASRFSNPRFVSQPDESRRYREALSQPGSVRYTRSIPTGIAFGGRVASGTAAYQVIARTNCARSSLTP
jgi:hypothetical protein